MIRVLSVFHPLLLVVLSSLVTHSAFTQVDLDRKIQLTGTGTDAKIEGLEAIEHDHDVVNKIYVDTAIVNRTSALGTCPGSREVFNSSGVWSKPGCGAMVYVQCWGGGGSGARSNSAGNSSAGGGGGGYTEGFFHYSIIPDQVDLTVGAGGPSIPSGSGAGNDGQNSTFGTFLTAFGGGGATRPGLGLTGGTTQSNTGGGGGAPFGGNGINNLSDYPTKSSTWGGGGGGASGYGTAGNSIYGGAGGGEWCGGCSSNKNKPGGTSLYAGNGGESNTTGAPGAVPAGGGGASSTGASGAGGNGRCIVTTW